MTPPRAPEPRPRPAPGPQALARAAIEAERRAASPGSLHAGALRGRALEVLQAALPEAWSPSQLEKYAECPFRLLLARFVRLPDDDAPDLDASARDEGSLLHRALELFHRARIARGAGPLRGDDAERADLKAALDAAIAGLEGEGRAGDPAAWAGRREVLATRLERHLAAEAAAADALVPVAVEHRFGGRRSGTGPDRAPLELSAGGATVRLEGRIDRVDASPGRLRVVDYKGGKSDGRADQGALLDPETWGESSFQVPTYLLAAARDFPGRTALEARYAFLRSADVKEASYDAQGGTPAAAGAFAEKVVELVSRIRAGAFPQVPGGCEHCPWPAVCRPERTAAPPAEGPGEAP